MKFIAVTSSNSAHVESPGVEISLYSAVPTSVNSRDVDALTLTVSPSE
jgi:hypothetical protein